MFRLTAAGGHVRARRAGFTLVEIIVALAVVGVASSVFIQLFMSSLDLARTSQNRSVAMGLAESKLAEITQNPDRFVWDTPDVLNLRQFPVRVGTDDPPAGHPVALPAAMPAVPSAHRVAEKVYDQFKWLAYGRLPGVNAPYIEVTVVVHWLEGKRPQMLALTSSAPRFKVPFRPAPGTEPQRIAAP